MENIASTAAQSVLQLVIFMIAGALAAKSGVLDGNGTEKLSSLIMKILLPMCALAAYLRDYDPSKNFGLFYNIGAGFAVFAAAVLLGFILLKRKNNENFRIELLCGALSNCGFVGIPLTSLLFGAEGVFYITGFLFATGICSWAFGYLIMSGRFDRRMIAKALLSNNMIAIYLGMILYFCRISLPGPVASAVRAMGDCTAPLSMFIAGAMLTRTVFSDLLKKPGLYISLAIKLVASPLIIMALGKLLAVPDIIGLSAMVEAACPPAAMLLVFAIEFDRDSVYTAGITSLGTVLSMLTIPLLVALW